VQSAECKQVTKWLLVYINSLL